MRCSGRVRVRATTSTSSSTVSSVTPCNSRRSRVSGLAESRKYGSGSVAASSRQPPFSRSTWITRMGARRGRSSIGATTQLSGSSRSERPSPVTDSVSGHASATSARRPCGSSPCKVPLTWPTTVRASRESSTGCTGTCWRLIGNEEARAAHSMAQLVDQQGAVLFGQVAQEADRGGGAGGGLARGVARVLARGVAATARAQIALPSNWLTSTPATITPMMRPRSVAGSSRSTQPARRRRAAESLMRRHDLDREHVA